MKMLSPNAQLIRSVLTFLGIILSLLLMGEYSLSDNVDSLDLQLQWAYPIRVVDMRLVDFNYDGINEILVGFNSDSSRIGILDAVTQSWVWQSPAFHGTIYTVAAGDRNNDGYFDIICGGQRSDSAIGYIEIFDGPTFDSTHTASGFDQIVLSAEISALWQDSLPQIILGTFYDQWSGGGSDWSYRESGGLFVLEGSDLVVSNVTSRGVVRKMLICDADEDGSKKLFLGLHSIWKLCSSEPIDATMWSCSIYSDSLGTLYLHVGSEQGISYDVLFDALQVGKFNDAISSSVIGCGHVNGWYWYIGHTDKLSCWNVSTRELEWCIIWVGPGYNYMTDLAICGFNSEEINAICAVYQNGLVEFRSGSNGSILAVSSRSHSIYHMKLGNVDQDDLGEICVSSGDSLYIYQTPSITLNVQDIEDYTHTMSFCLFQNYPNPFNPQTNIRFDVPTAVKVTITIYSILGEKVREFEKSYEAGTHTLIWDGKNSSGDDVASGVYLYKLSAGNYQETRKMVLIK